MVMNKTVIVVILNGYSGSLKKSDLLAQLLYVYTLKV